MMKQNHLLVSLIVAVMSMSATSAVHADQVYQLSGITVTGEKENSVQEIPGGMLNRTGVVGILGAKDVMDTPFQQNNLTEKALDRFGADPSQASTSILVNVPSVRTVGNTLYNDFSIRGQRADAYQMRINGIPGLLSQNNTPTNMFERIEVTSGPGLSISGVQAKESAGGIINMVTKRAGKKDSITYKTYFSGQSTFGNIINVSQRVGTDREWGINVNGAYISGNTGIDKEKVTNKNLSFNIDHNDQNSSTNLFVSYRNTLTKQAERYFDFSSKDLTKIPKAPNSRNNYTFDGHQLGMRTFFGTFNHVQKISDDFQVFINAGASYNKGYRYIVDKWSRLDVLNDKGDFSRNILNEPYAIRNNYLELGFTKDFSFNDIKNKLTVSWSKDWYQARWGNSVNDKGTSKGNLYEGKVTFDKITKNQYAYGYWGENEFYGWTAVDTLSFDNLDLMLGVHYHTAAIYSATGEATKSSAPSPFFGFVYKPESNLSIFGHHSESFTQGKIVGAHYENKGKILPPTKMKSNELGIKYINNNIVHSLSYFDMRQANYRDVTEKVNGENKLYLRSNGETKYSGIEYSVSGKLTDKLSLSGGFMYLNSSYSKTNDTFLEGKKVQGVSDWSSVLTLSYEPTEQLEVWGRMVHTGAAPLYNNKRIFTFDPSTAVDIGLTYKSTISTMPVTYSMTVFNVFNSNYWLPRPTTTMGILSQPRAFYLGAELKF